SPSSDGKFQINLSKDDTMKLSAGSNELKLLAISNLALKPDVYTTSIIGLAGQVPAPEPTPTPQPQPQPQPSPAPAPNSGCLIATAAFGSELCPQVQFLRGFRDSRILSTEAGSSFMNVFNAWYYSFSPYVADYERNNPWLQQIVKAAIYPLIGILLLSETSYASFSGEYGAVIAGLTASSLIGAVYFTPLALLIRKARPYKLSLRVPLIVFGAVVVSILVGIVSNSTPVLMASTAAMVLSTLIFSALLLAKVLERYVIVRIRQINIRLWFLSNQKSSA
ncbi:MAG: CFI-box-CTERM domain-containing protein, partial [Nitrososphaerales archaeon]